ncbi:unnamed protein product [Oppiella nova]|uniref:Uncharacterized protein n=1 Tax=Oppiella nova TaxID=334625 RepID=A0A7R9LM01_9ACAR|nr:unnamed protein product [Oppiella nova]CAG2164323.1 unnamed protein product [Oppiella nova]
MHAMIGVLLLIFSLYTITSCTYSKGYDSHGYGGYGGYGGYDISFGNRSAHELFDHFISNCFTPFLMLCHNCLQNTNQLLLEISSQQLSTTVFTPDLLQTVVVFQKEIHLPPFARCSSMVAPPPEKAYRLILFLIWLGVSVRNIELLGSEALIFVWAPVSAGRNDECKRAGLGRDSLGATSRVIRKYGS